MSLNGNLNDFSVLETLQLIALQKKSGLLTVESGRRRRDLHFAEGRLIGCSAVRPEDPDPTLNTLVTLGFCEARQARAWRSHTGTIDSAGLREGCGLDDEGYETLRRFVLQATIDEILIWERGQFRFTPGSVPSADASFNLEEFLLESMRRLDEAAEHRASSFPPTAVPAPVATPRPGALDPLEPPLRWTAAAFLRHCDGRRSLRRIAGELGLSEYDLLTTASALRQHGLIRLVLRGRAEDSVERLLEQPRRLPDPLAPLWVAAILLATLLLGWSAHSATRAGTWPEHASALDARHRFESDHSLRYILEISKHRDGVYPASLSELEAGGLWPRDRRRDLRMYRYRPTAGRDGYELERVDWRKSATDRRSSPT